MYTCCSLLLVVIHFSKLLIITLSLSIGYSAEGGAVGVGWVQWIVVVLYNTLVYNIIQITTPCFHCNPL